MQAEAIPWRSLNAYKDTDEVKQRYHVVFGIPCNLLVAPGGNAEFVDVRDIEQREKLYSVCDNPYALP